MAIDKQVVLTDDPGQFILSIRGQRVIVDSDLAKIYGVPTGRLNEQVKRNRERFPPDFMFQLSREEAEAWRSLRSQNAILKRGEHIKYLPYAFTEHGAIMAANILNSKQAITMSIYVIRAFVRLKEEFALNHLLTKRLVQIEKTLLAHDVKFRDIYQKIRPLLLTPSKSSQRKIGFHKE